MLTWSPQAYFDGWHHLMIQLLTLHSEQRLVFFCGEEYSYYENLLLTLGMFHHHYKLFPKWYSSIDLLSYCPFRIGKAYQENLEDFVSSWDVHLVNFVLYYMSLFWNSVVDHLIILISYDLSVFHSDFDTCYVPNFHLFR